MPIESEDELRRLVEEEGWGVYFRKDKDRWYAYKRVKGKTSTQLIAKELDWVAGELAAAIKKKREGVSETEIVRRFMELSDEEKKKVVSWGTFVREYLSPLVPEEDISTYLLEAIDLYREHRVDIEALEKEVEDYGESLDALKEKFEGQVRRLKEILGFAAFVRSSLKLGLISKDSALDMLMAKIFGARMPTEGEEEAREED
ncbi:MAG: hypothetical protein ACE5GD_08635 [Candidatus Geothermarchaeales archaeon]